MRKFICTFETWMKKNCWSEMNDLEKVWKALGNLKSTLYHNNFSCTYLKVYYAENWVSNFSRSFLHYSYIFLQNKFLFSVIIWDCQNSLKFQLPLPTGNCTFALSVVFIMYTFIIIQFYEGALSKSNLILSS